jgi:fructosamine-3-kinase
VTASASVVRLADGRTAYVKRWAGCPDGFFRSEARGLAWLAESRTVAVPDVIAVDDRSITLEPVPRGRPGARGAESFGRALADLHASAAPDFGAPWPGFIGPLPMENRPIDGDGPSGRGDRGSWAAFYAERRVLPFARAARDRGALSAAGLAAVEGAMERLRDDGGAWTAERPSRLHGDLWSGNVLWGPDGTAWVIDPAAHGGHRETDLAMLALFGAPHLDRIVAAYDEHRPLADGWRQRVGLHQLHPLLVHAVLFGAGYGDQAATVAARAG